MAHHEEYAQKTSRDKYKTIARAKAMSHGELSDHIQSHMLGCTDPDCDICDMGQSGSFIDDEKEEERGSKGDNIDNLGERTARSSKGDKTNLMKHGEHTSAHPGFKAVQSRIASQEGLSKKAAGAILAARSRSASASAHKINPRLNRVRG
jgi:hypothetical protein